MAGKDLRQPRKQKRRTGMNRKRRTGGKRACDPGYFAIWYRSASNGSLKIYFDCDLASPSAFFSI
jgi:hypothetical protein